MYAVLMYLLQSSKKPTSYSKGSGHPILFDVTREIHQVSTSKKKTEGVCDNIFLNINYKNPKTPVKINR